MKYLVMTEETICRTYEIETGTPDEAEQNFTVGDKIDEYHTTERPVDCIAKDSDQDFAERLAELDEDLEEATEEQEIEEEIEDEDNKLEEVLKESEIVIQKKEEKQDANQE